MRQQNAFLRISVPSLVGSILLCQGPAQAQQVAPVQLAPNDQVIQAWQGRNLGGAVPALTQDADGTSRLDWRGGITVDVYGNDIQSAGGSANTQLRAGSFYKDMFTSDLRAIHQDNTVEHFQLGVTSSDDRAVLSQNLHQINYVQVGRTGEDYSVALGDIAPNFSSLSSALGVRGFYGQRQFDNVTVHGFSGRVTENWEVLSSTVPSNQYMKDVQGVKIEKAFDASLRTYMTAQTSSERDAPFMAQPGFAPLGKSHSMSAGFQYQKDQFNLSGETAGSHFEDGGTSNRQGHAIVIDANWRGESVGLRAGHHQIDSKFTSLSLASQPGVHETYIGVDWTTASWVTLNTDMRKSKNPTLATVYSESTFVDTDALTVRADINFGPNHPGWAMSLQQVEAQSIDSADLASRRTDTLATLYYASPDLVTGLTFGKGKNSGEAWPFYDSATENWAFYVGRAFSNAQPDMAPTWNTGVNFSTTSQTQRLLSTGAQSKNTNYTLAFSGQLVGWGGMNLLLTGGETSQLNGGPTLHLRGAQLDVVFPMKGQSTFKVYAHSAWRYVEDPLLSAQEDVFGMQLIYNF